MSSFNQGVPGPATLINSSNCIVYGNTSSGTALTVQQLGAGAVMNVATSTGSSALFVSSTGQVGIGTTGPGSLLQVYGDLTSNSISSITYRGQLNFTQANWSGTQRMYLGRFGGGGSNGQVGQVRMTIHDWGYSHGAGHEILLSFNWGVNTPVIHSHGPNPYTFYYYTAGSTSVYDLWFSDTTSAPAGNQISWTAWIYSSGGWQNIADPGNSSSATLITNGIYNTGSGVGIGTTSPGYTLQVNGTMAATYASAGNGSYVFGVSTDYRAMMTLNHATGTNLWAANQDVGDSDRTLSIQTSDSGSASGQQVTMTLQLSTQGTRCGLDFKVARDGASSQNPLYTITQFTGTVRDLYYLSSTKAYFPVQSVGIGVTTPAAPLTIYGTASGNRFGIGNADVYLVQGQDSSTNGSFIQCYAGGNSSTIGTSAYRLLLQPYGSSVIIGGTADNGNRFQVNGISNFTGNVGIGTTSPACQLHLWNGTSGGQIGIAQQNDSTAYMRMGMDTSWGPYIAINGYWTGSAWNYVNTGGYGGTAAMIYMSSGTINFETASGGVNPVPWVTRMSITNGGYVGIGTNGPQTILHAAQNCNATGDLDASSGQLMVSSADTVRRLMIGYDCSTTNGYGWIKCGNYHVTWTNLALCPNGGNVGIGITNPSYNLQVAGTIGASGDITAFYSDERLKTKTGTLTGALDKVCSLDTFTYVNNELAQSFGFKDTKERLGLSAQQVQKVAPQTVSPAPFDAENQSGQNYLTVQYEKLVPLLIEALKEERAARLALEEKLGLK